MAFIQKDKHSRKDKLDQAAAGPAPRRPRVVIHRGADGSSHMHLDIPEGGMNKEDHLTELLDRLEAQAAEGTEVTESR